MLLKWILTSWLATICISAATTPSWRYTSDLQANWGQAILSTPINSSFNYTIEIYPAMPTVVQMIIGMLGFEASAIDSSPLGFDAVVSALSPSNFTLRITTYNNSQFKTLRFSSFAKSSNIDYLQFSYASIGTFKNLSTGNGDRWQRINYVITSIPMNLSHRNMLIPFLRMFVFDRTTTMDLNLGVTLHIINSTNYYANFTTNGDTQVLSASFCRITYDITSVQATQTVFIDTKFLVGTQSTSNPMHFHSSSMKSVFFGINSFRLAANEIYSIYFINWVPLKPYTFLNISFINYRERVCPATHPYYIETFGSCVDVCSSGMQSNLLDMYCYNCPLGCNTCISMTQCTQCSRGTGRTLVNGNCLCVGLIETNKSFCGICAVTCATCVDIATNCLTCPNSSFRVLNASNNSCDCLPGYIDTGKPACATCGMLFIGCLTCNATTCFSCDKNFELTKGRCVCPDFLQGGQCLNCAGLILGCTTCQNESQCYNCTYLYQKDKDGVCFPICGDGYQTKDEQCDDGNFQNGDGCSHQCKIEEDFQCRTQETNGKSYCSYSKSLKLIVKKQQKDFYSNQIELQINVLPQLKSLTAKDFSQAVFNVNNTSVFVEGVQYNPKDKILKLRLAYTSAIQFEIMDCLLIAPNNSFTFAIQPSKLQIFVDPVDMPAYFYSQDTYTQVRAIQIVNWAVYALGLVVFIGGAIANNPIAVQQICVLQLSYFSISNVARTIHPLWASYRNVWFINGYNKINFILNSQILSTGSKALTVLTKSPTAFLDFNCMFVIHVLLLIATLACLLRRKKGDKAMGVYLQVRSISRSVALLNLMNLGYCFGLHLAYISILPFVEMVVGFVVTGLAFFVLYLPKILPDNEINQQTIFLTKIRYLIHFHILAFLLFICGFLSGLLHYTGAALFIIFGFQMLYFIYICVFNPYKQKLDMVRSILTFITGIWVTLQPVVFWATDNSIKRQQVSTHLCWITIVILMLSVMFSGACIIRKVVIDRKAETLK